MIIRALFVLLGSIVIGAERLHAQSCHLKVSLIETRSIADPAAPKTLTLGDARIEFGFIPEIAPQFVKGIHDYEITLRGAAIFGAESLGLASGLDTILEEKGIARETRTEHEIFLPHEDGIDALVIRQPGQAPTTLALPRAAMGSCSETCIHTDGGQPSATKPCCPGLNEGSTTAGNRVCLKCGDGTCSPDERLVPFGCQADCGDYGQLR